MVPALMPPPIPQDHSESLPRKKDRASTMSPCLYGVLEVFMPRFMAAGGVSSNSSSTFDRTSISMSRTRIFSNSVRLMPRSLVKTFSNLGSPTLNVSSCLHMLDGTAVPHRGEEHQEVLRNITGVQADPRVLRPGPPDGVAEDQRAQDILS